MMTGGWRISCKELTATNGAVMVVVECPETGQSKYWRVEAGGRISTIAKTQEQCDQTLAILARLGAVDILVEPCRVHDPYSSSAEAVDAP